MYQFGLRPALDMLFCLKEARNFMSGVHQNDEDRAGVALLEGVSVSQIVEIICFPQHLSFSFGEILLLWTAEQLLPKYSSELAQLGLEVTPEFVNLVVCGRQIAILMFNVSIVPCQYL